jgi:hypothetical protein
MKLCILTYNDLRSAPGLYPDQLIPLRYAHRVSVVKNTLCALWIEIDLRRVEDVKAVNDLIKSNIR